MSRIIEKDLSYQITGLCFRVQRKLGRFCRERQYCDEFEDLLKFEKVNYKREYNIVQLNPKSPAGNKVDFYIAQKILVDFKAKNYITKEDYYQMLRYLFGANLELGMIVNFRDSHLKPKRVLNSAFNSGNSDSNSGNSGRALGIDYGEKRIGLAISDESQVLARELTILSPKEFWKQIPSIIGQHQITTIVLGWPLNMSGEETEKTKEVARFKVQVESKTGLKVEVMDERLSSAMTKNLPGGDKNKDSLAAQIILQNYLNRPKSTNYTRMTRSGNSDNSDNDSGHSDRYE
ncbi:MAG: Holliday junction resolvase RuvX [Patescibacteria group bacterium]